MELLLLVKYNCGVKKEEELEKKRKKGEEGKDRKNMMTFYSCL